MDWYSSVGRKLFFALPPEASHTLALAILGLPLPWERIAGAAPADPRLETVVSATRLRNPIGLAAGFDKRCARLDVLGRLGFGYVIGGTVTSGTRRGSPKPRIVRHPSRRSFVNSMGLPNPGAVRAARNLSSGSRTAPRWVSVADEPLHDALETFASVEPFADALELNASCPNVSWGRDRDDEKHIGELVKGFRARTDKPIFVKLAPYSNDKERDGVLGLAASAIGSGASGLTCSNTRRVDEPLLASGAGGLSGAALSDLTPKIVDQVRAATGATINASGGIFTGADALASLEAGASTVQIYAALIYRGPSVITQIARELSSLLAKKGTDIASLGRSAA